MRNFFKKRGLTAVILATIVAIAFLPKQVAQWVILAAVGTWCIVNGIIFFVNHKESFKRRKIKKTSKKAEKKNAKVKESDATLYFKYLVIQFSHRITDKLHTLYPDSSWQWADNPTPKMFSNGGHVRIITMNTEEFHEADVLMDSLGRIDIKMVQTCGINDIIKQACPEADTDYSVDLGGRRIIKKKQALTQIITEINAQGVRKLSIDEEGNVTLENSNRVSTLTSFPSKNLWKRLVDLFKEDGLQADATENSILLSW